MEIQSYAEQQTAEPDLCTSPPNLTKLLLSIADVVCCIDEYGIFRYVSPNSSVLFGYTPQEMMGASFLNFIHPADIAKTLHVASERTHGCTTSDFRNSYIRKDASIVSIIWSARWDEEDRLLYCVARDASENEVMHQRLVKAQQMARVANFEFDVLQNRYCYVSDTLFEIFGLNPSQNPAFTTDIFWSLVHPEDLPKVKAAINPPDATNAESMEYRIMRPDGQIVYINRLREVVRDAGGRVVKTIGTIQDITERKIIEQALQQSEERFRSLVQNGNDLLGIIDEAGNYTYVSANVQELLGVRAEFLKGKNVLEFMHPQDAALVGRSLQDIKGRKTITVGPFRFQSGCGGWRWMETTATNHLDNPAIRGITLNSRDVTERKAKDDTLALSEQRFKALVHDGSDLIVIIDRQHLFTYISDNVSTILGYTPDELVGRSAFDFIHPKDIRVVKAELSKVHGRDDAATGVQHRFLHKNGSWVWLESKGTNQLDNSTLQGVLINARNINDRVKLQKRLNQELLNKQKEITAAVITAQETERSQMGLELHDNVNQVLATVKLYIEMYLSGYEQGRDLLVRSMQYTQECINEIRCISKRLSAPTIGQISLMDSILELVDSINLSGRIKISCRIEGVEHVEVGEDLHLAVYRIVQEGLNNILKYSQAGNAEVAIWTEGQRLCVLLSDDGVGFEMNAKRTGIGITNMKTRAENLNATFIVDSKPGKGCRINVLFPLHSSSWRLTGLLRPQ